MNCKNIEQWLVENQEKPADLTVEILANILQYKAKNIKAHIPAWVFKETVVALLGAYGKVVLTDDGMKIKWQVPNEPSVQEGQYGKLAKTI